MNIRSLSIFVCATALAACAADGGRCSSGIMRKPASCTQQEAEDALRRKNYSSATQLYIRADAASDARSSYTAGDLRIYALVQFAPFWPGLDGKTGHRLSQRYDSIPLIGVSDCILSVEHGNYMDAALKYAETYNREMARLLTGSRL